MIITKFSHSCLLIEENGVTILIDPGVYTYSEKSYDLSAVSKLDYLLITHEHQDHMYIPFIQEVIGKFPGVTIVSNDSIRKVLSKEGIVVSVEGDENVEIEKVKHEPLLGKAPENTLFHLFGKLTHPGDSLSFSKSMEILALPIQAPWGSLVRAVEKAVVLKPRVIVPIHDWHWRVEARASLYEMAKNYLLQLDINFVDFSDGNTVKL